MNDSKLPQMLKPCKQGQCPTVPPLLCKGLIPDNDGTAPDPTVTSEAPRDFAELLRTRVLFCLNKPHLKNEAGENSLQIPSHFLSAEEMSEINSKLAASLPCQKYLCLDQSKANLPRLAWESRRFVFWLRGKTFPAASI